MTRGWRAEVCGSPKGNVHFLRGGAYIEPGESAFLQFWDGAGGEAECSTVEPVGLFKSAARDGEVACARPLIMMIADTRQLVLKVDGTEYK
jgi:hypothetical protein